MCHALGYKTERAHAASCAMPWDTRHLKPFHMRCRVSGCTQTHVRADTRACTPCNAAQREATSSTAVASTQTLHPTPEHVSQNPTTSTTATTTPSPHLCSVLRLRLIGVFVRVVVHSMQVSRHTRRPWRTLPPMPAFASNLAQLTLRARRSLLSWRARWTWVAHAARLTHGTGLAGLAGDPRRAISSGVALRTSNSVLPWRAIGTVLARRALGAGLARSARLTGTAGRPVPNEIHELLYASIKLGDALLNLLVLCCHHALCLHKVVLQRLLIPLSVERRLILKHVYLHKHGASVPTGHLPLSLALPCLASLGCLMLLRHAC
jgi:hypothetical protein